MGYHITEPKSSWMDGSAKRYQVIANMLQNKLINANDIEDFSLALAEFQEKRAFPYAAGLMLSALINLSDGTNCRVVPAHLNRAIDLLGFENKKNVLIKGNVGDFVAWRMCDAGTLTVEGDAKNNPGWSMRGGTLVINGSAGDDVGVYMKAGKIIIHGPVGYLVGENMSGGDIMLYNDYLGLTRATNGGSVYHNGERLIGPGPYRLREEVEYEEQS